MKASELMIGDYILYKGKTNCVVTALWRYEISVKSFLTDGGVAYSSLIEAKLFEPFPLTVEILEKNFKVLSNEPYGNRYFYNTDYVEVEVTEYTDGTWQVVVDEIEMSGLPTWKMYVSYVHELQHALRFAGVEKEIEI